MEIVAEGIEVTGPHGPLLPPTSLRVRDRELLLVTTEPGSASTALALALSGRLRPSRGTVRCDGAADTALLRRNVLVVDAPEVTEPDASLSVRHVAAEGLGIAGRPSRRTKVRSWLAERDLDQYARTRFEHLPPAVRTRLLLDLATQRPDRLALILDCPDRHGGPPVNWFSLALREAARGSAVIVICSPHSAEKLGAAHARIGSDNRELSALSLMDCDEGAR